MDSTQPERSQEDQWIFFHHDSECVCVIHSYHTNHITRFKEKKNCLLDIVFFVPLLIQTNDVYFKE